MATDKQIAANRANAQKSTGPKTPEGKANSRRNSTRHNLTGTPALRTGAEKEAFDAYFDRLIPCFAAGTELEHELAARVIDVMFRLARIPALETNIYAIDCPAAEPTPEAQAIAQAKTFIRESRTFSNLSLYEQRLSRTLQKDLDTLQRLKNPRQQKGVNAHPRPRVVRWVDENGVDTSPPVYLPPEDGPGPIETKPLDKIGFVFSPARPVTRPPGIAA